MSKKTGVQGKSSELSDAELDQVKGAGTKGLIGDDIGILRGGDKFTPQPKQMERVHEDE